MTSILPSERTSGDITGRLIREQMSQNLPGAVQTGIERGQIQNGLQKLAQMYPQLRPYAESMAPFAGTRQGAQYVEALLPEIQKAVQSTQQVNPQTGEALQQVEGMLNPQRTIYFGGGQTETKVHGKPPVTQQQQQQQPDYESSYKALEKGMGEQYFPKPRKAPEVGSPESKRPQKPLIPPKPITQVEEQRMRAILEKNGVTDKALQDQYIAQSKKQRQDEYQAEKEGFANVQEYQKARTAEDDRFWEAVAPSVKEIFPGMNAEEENIWKGIARTNEDVGSDEARLRDTNERYNQLIYQPLAAFVDTGPVLPYASAFREEKVKDAVEDSRSMIQDHLKTIRDREEDDSFPPELKSETLNYLRKKYRSAMLEKDFGTSQSAYAVSNLEPTTVKAFEKIPKYPVGEVGVKDVFSFESPSFEKPVSAADKTKYTNILAGTLRNLKPTDSLILSRDAAISQKYPEEVFNRALRMAIENGLILSPFQMQERPELSIPQLMDLDSVLRGKRTVWDLFKGKK